jgi:anti-sigma regulatory factor (Ser/Thr protein kinase)
MDELAWVVEDRSDAVLVTARGPFTLRSAVAFGGVLRKLLMDRGRVIVDISEVHVLRPATVVVFATTLTQAGGWPFARLVLIDTVGAVATALRAIGGTSEVSLVADRDAAPGALDVRPQRIRRTTDLPLTAAAPVYARALVRAACSDWSISGVEDCCAVVNELVTNAVQHAGGARALLLTYDHRGLTISVQDGSTVMPSKSLGPQPSGLRMVQELSKSWGALRHDDGKTVWASVSSAREEPGG